MTRAEHLATKYGMSVEQARAAEQQMTERAAAEGLDFRFDIARAGNTLDGHRVLHLAAEHGVQDAVKERFMRAYFGEGELMSDPATLVRLATEAGLPEDEVRDTLASDRFTAEVRADQETAYGFGISGVPFFVRRPQARRLRRRSPPRSSSRRCARPGRRARRSPSSPRATACGVDGC